MNLKLVHENVIWHYEPNSVGCHETNRHFIGN